MLSPAAVQAISTHLNSLSIGATAGPSIAAPLTQSDVRSASVGRTRLHCAVFNNSPQPLYSADCFASPPYKI